MDKHISSNSLFHYACELEKFEATSIAELVIEKAILSGFITDQDTDEDKQKRAWIMRVTKHAEFAYNLDAVADGESIEVKIANLNLLIQQRDEKIAEILHLLAKRVSDAAPPYKL